MEGWCGIVPSRVRGLDRELFPGSYWGHPEGQSNLNIRGGARERMKRHAQKREVETSPGDFSLSLWCDRFPSHPS